MLTISLRIAAVCLVAASVVATTADAQHRGRGGGGGGGGRGFGGGGGRSIGHSAPAFRSAPSFRSAPRIHTSSPSVRRSVTRHQLSSPRINKSVVGRSVTTTRTVKGPTGVRQGIVSQTSSVPRNRTAIQKSVLRNRSITATPKGANRPLAR